MHTFSCFKLENAQNPSLLCVFIGKLPLMSRINHSEILTQHPNTIHKAREAFITNENTNE